jgi:hypothetical protein
MNMEIGNVAALFHVWGYFFGNFFIFGTVSLQCKDSLSSIEN